MDQAGLDAVLHKHALDGLARLNRFSRAAAILFPPIAALAARRPAQPLRILDLASGGGDNAVQLWRKARARGLELQISGWDRSPHATAHARALAETSGAPVVFECRDVLADPFPEGLDVMMSSLFLHHLAEPQALELLGKMRLATGELVLINDLRRSRAGLALALAAANLLTASAVVHHDAPASVRAALTMDEALRLARQAGMAEATVAGRWPCRYLLAWSRPVRHVNPCRAGEGR